MTNENISKPVKGHARHGHWHKLSGILLAVLGFFWLAKKIGWIPVAAGGSVIFWPVLTIVLGLWLAFSRHRVKAGDKKWNIEAGISK
jgi:Zn-dependent protease with chaperone function